MNRIKSWVYAIRTILAPTLWFLAVVLLFFTGSPWGMPYLLSLVLKQPWIVGWLLTWFVCGVAFKFGIDSLDNDTLDNISEEKLPTVPLEVGLLFAGVISLGSLAIWWGFRPGVQDLLIQIMCLIFAGFIGVLIGVQIVRGYTNSSAVSNEDISHKTPDEAIEAGESCPFFRPTQWWCRFPFLFIALGSLAGAMAGIYISLLFYPLPGNIYEGYLANFFPSFFPPLLGLLIILITISVLFVLAVYPHIEKEVGLIILLCTGFSIMGAFGAWGTNLSISSEIPVIASTINALSLTILVVGVLWGAYRSYQVFRYGESIMIALKVWTSNNSEDLTKESHPSVPALCPFCGAPNSSEATFCTNCGKKLSKEE
ncbi:MAG: zinc ribbon domain-containing protein [Candidatus Hodarchaeota archaeon]